MNGLPLAISEARARRDAREAPGLRAHESDRAAARERLAALFDAHHQRLYRLARRLVPTTDDALDLVQETFLRAARTPTSIPAGVGNEQAWLVRVLVNIRRDQWRKAGVRNRVAAESREAAIPVTDAEASLIAQTAIWSALDALSPRRRAVVVLHELDGLTVKDVAALLGISAITVRWHLSTGRRELARILKPFIGETE
jgi:RNA polymerase sigma factor (sigma-70 family)